MIRRGKNTCCFLVVFFVLLLLFILMTSCAKPRRRPVEPWKKGVYHIIKKGQTLWRIARTYGVDLLLLAEVNAIEDPTYIKAGDALFIPGAPKVLEVEIYHPPTTPSPAASSLGFIWPVVGKVTSGFGMRHGRKHTGIDIDADAGDPIKAAYDGKVIYSGSKFKGYGNMIIIEHANDFTTIYAHNKENLVKEGEWVTQGQVIALVGKTGEASGSHLHFEIHLGDKPLDPLEYLQK
jgi:murein DD-endopeptidase MepM/ murein hydrolase activator NlpD